MSYEFNSSVLKTADDFENYSISSKAILPHSGGEKCYAPSGTWLEEKQLDLLIQERFDVMKEERIAKRSDISYGEWHQELQFVVVTKGKGRLVQRMGFHQDGKHFLYPVEALFLMESSVLQVTFNGFPLSIEQGYAMLLKDGLEKYQVFSHLTRLGYTVVIYQKGEHATPYEKKIRLDQHVNMEKKPSLNLTEKSVDGPKALNQQKCQCISANHTCSLPLPKITSDSEDLTKYTSAENLKSLNNLQDVSPETRDRTLEWTRPNEQLFPFPLSIPNKDIKLNRPPPHLLPKNVSPARPFYTLYTHRPELYPFQKVFTEPWRQRKRWRQNARGSYSVGSTRNVRDYQSYPREEPSSSRLRFPYPQDRSSGNSCRAVQGHDKWDVNLRRRFAHEPKHKAAKFSEKRMKPGLPCASLEEYPSAIPKLKLEVTSWKEFKSAAALSTADGWPLFVDEVQPLVTTTLSTDKLQSTIKVISEVSFDNLANQFCRINSDLKSCYNVDFSVYSPSTMYKKHNPSHPSLRVSVISLQHSVPNLADLAALQIDDVPLYFAVVENGEVNFFGIQPVTLCPVNPMSLL